MNAVVMPLHSPTSRRRARRRRWVWPCIGICLLLFTSLSGLAQEDRRAPLTEFVQPRGDQLFVGEDEFRFVSFNIPNLHLVEDNFSFADPNPWRWPDAFEIADALESVRQMGGTVVRIYVLSVRREGSDMGDHVFVRGPGEFNERAFQALDQVLAIARAKGVRVIIPLVDNWHWWGGRAEYARFRGKEPDDFWSDEQVIADFEATIRHTLGRVNSMDGVAYKDDPAIFGWETGNELDSTPEWTARIATLMKRLDPHHLIIDGYALHGVRQESLDDPNIDVITTHHYPNTDADYVTAITAAHEKIAGRKPYFVGEFGFVPTTEVERVLDTVHDRGISGALIWSLRFHNRDGGFYWHWETASDGLYKAYHWPGFDSGAGYDERKVLALMRKKAYAIRGIPPPPLTPPLPPTLLPIDDIGAISWQGSAGAKSYDVQRAATSSGPWKVVGRNISDARVQYRPLFHDPDPIIGSEAYYRVLARNQAGQSAPSNLVGPVTARGRVMIDECADRSQISEQTGDVRVVTDNSRRAQEDCHRLRLEAGSSITYHGATPIKQFTVYAFTTDEAPSVVVESSSDGEHYAPCEVQTEQDALGPGDYGYHRPLLLEGRPVAGTTYLRIAVEAAQLLEISRVEIRM